MLSIRNFFTCGRFGRQRQEKFDRVEIPNDLLDPISFVPLVDPVVTPTGHCFSRRTITRQIEERGVCPLTNQPLTLALLRPGSAEIINLAEEFNRFRSRMQNEIMVIFSIEKTINTYQRRMLELAPQMAEARQRLIIQSSIQQIKSRLKIDLNNPIHITYWRNKGRFGGMPGHIPDMMRVANIYYNSVHDFIKAIDKARQIGSFSRLFKSIISKPQTRDLYNTPDLRNFTIQ